MGDDIEDYGFEYSDEEVEEEDVDVENQYYNAKSCLEEEDWEEAMEGFQRVIEMEEEQESKGEWGFKALKQIVKLHYRAGKMQDVLSNYGKMLSYMDGSVTKNHAEKKINSTLDHVSQCTDAGFLQSLYETTLGAVSRAGNERLWFKTSVKLATLWLQRRDWARLGRVMRDLKKSCLTEEGEEDPRKGTQLLEVYALEIQMHTEQGNKKKLKELYLQALAVKSAIPHPRILGVIRECGGKMHMRERQWTDAATSFFEAFKSYDEAGHPRRLQCLKYLVLATMLSASGVDPFNAQEAKPFKSDPEVIAMTSLVEAYQSNRIDQFERLLRQHKGQILGDSFVASHVQELLRALRSQVLMQLLQPYESVRIPFICEQLNVSSNDVEELLVTLIHEGKISGKIDQVDQIVRMKGGERQEDAMFKGMQQWAVSVARMGDAIRKLS